MNINGRVCLLNSTLFGIMSIVVVYIIHPVIQDIVMDIPFTALMSFLSAFTIGFGIDCVFTVLALLRRKQVFQKVQVQMEAFKKDFEAESQLRVQEAQEAFQEWMLSRPDLSERIEEFQSSLDNFSLEAKKHISKAFPERRISTEIRNIVADGKLALERRRLNANKQAEYCELTNMVMIQDEKGNVLVQNSKNPNGYTLPTGHIELGESFVQSAMRDVKEKTGLNVEQLCLCGTKQFISSDNCRHIVFLYKTNVFNGIENEESKWIPLSNIHDYKLISGLNDVLEVFEGTKYNELYYNAQYQLKKY
jgi:ADP-ribose pyrophosphatase YjhB (NUDIX family)